MRLSPLLLVATLLASVAVAGACATQANVPWGTGTATSGTRTPTGTPTFTGTVTGVPPTPTPPSLTVTGTVSLEKCSALVSQDSNNPTMNVRGGYLFKPGDEVLAWQVQDQVSGVAVTTAGLANAGLFDVLHVASTDTSSEAEELLVFNPPPVNTYHVNFGGDVHPNAQVCLVLPFTNLTVGASTPGLMTATAWNGTAGGVVAIHVWGQLDLESNGTITAAGMGFRGGVMNSSLQGCQGTPASGDGEGLDNATFGSLGPLAANFGGGGGGPELSGGGGGANGGNGGSGGAGFGTVAMGSASCVNDGGAGGSYSLSFSSNDRIFLGGGGGAGSSRPAIHQPGASGGGVVFLLIEPTAALKGTGVIDVSGSAIGNVTLPTSSYFGGAGGGAGGTVWAYVASTDFVMSPSFTTSANGGAGQSLLLSPVPHPSSPEPGGGGGGGGGRVVTFGFLPGGAFAKPGPPGLVSGSGGQPVNSGSGAAGLPGSEVSNPLPPGKVPGPAPLTSR